MKNVQKMAASKRGEVNEVAQALKATNLLANTKLVAFNRELDDAHPDEKARYDAIYPTEIAPYYTAQAIDEAKISSQFLDEGEPISKDNRELVIRLKYFEGINFEIASQGSAPLGFLSGFENSEMRIAKETMGGKHVLIVTFPDLQEADLYGYDPNAGIYLYGTTIPM